MALVVAEENGMIMKTERPKYSKKILSERHFAQNKFHMDYPGYHFGLAL
jgi:hypothetical protein